MEIFLSERQKSVVNATDKNVLVIAGAGSGKTRVLTERINYLISELKKGEKILAITFSNKAADELKERLILAMGEEQVNSCLFVGTIHKFCLEILMARSNIIGLPNNLQIFESFEDRLRIFIQAINNVPQFKSKYLSNDNKANEKKVRNLLNNLSNAKRNLKFSNDYNDKPLVKLVFKEYDALLLEQGAIDFDDILRYTYQIFTQRESVIRLYRKIYKYMCVDEAQDLNKAQYEIIKSFAGDSIGITMVGDPNQSIYGFNGSDSKYFNDIFVREYNPKKYILEENYRSSKKVIEAAKKIEPTYEVNGVCPYEGEFVINSFEDEISEAEWVFNKLNKLISKGHPDIENEKIEFEKCAVLARNRYVFNSLKKLLDENSIEYTLKMSQNNAFSSESNVVKAFELGMRLLVNDKDKIHLEELNRILDISKGTSFKELAEKNSDNIYTQNILECLKKSWSILEKTKDNINFKHTIEKMEEVLNIIVDVEEKILVYNDLNAWKSQWGVYVRKSANGERRLENFIRSVSLGTTQVENNKGLILSTVHMSKGLEFDVVFIMGMNEGTFPDYRALNNDNQLEEEKHNIFVAITRSKRLCYLTYPKSKYTPWGTKFQKKSRFIEMLEE